MDQQGSQSPGKPQRDGNEPAKPVTPNTAIAKGDTRDLFDDQTKDASTDRRADVRGHVAQARTWTPEEAKSRAASDLSELHSPRPTRAGDAVAMDHLREDMALRARNSSEYRAELQRLDPQTTREILAQPVTPALRAPRETDRGQEERSGHQLPGATPAKQQEAQGQAGPERTEQAEVNMIAALTGGRRSVDTELDAQQRSAARASIAANDRQGDAKRDVIDHMTPDDLRRFVGASDRQAADKVLRDTASREERASATAAPRVPSPPLNERFNVRRFPYMADYEFRDKPGTMAFTERFNTLRTTSSSPSAAIAMIDRAGERGWSTIRVSGGAEFKRQVWIAAEARGIKAVGYEPTKGDMEAAKAERARLAREHEMAVRARPGRTDDEVIAVKEARKQAEYALGRTERGTGEERPARAADAGQRSASEHEKADEQQRNHARGQERQRDQERSGSRAVGAAAFMSALEQVMERDKVPESQRPRIRQIAERQFDALRAEGKTARVRLVDRQAPRRVPQHLPHHEIKRAAQERSR